MHDGAPSRRQAGAAPRGGTASWLQRWLRRNDPHSLYVQFAASLLLLSIIVDALLLDLSTTHPLLYPALFTVCITLTVAAGILGERLSRTAGLLGVIAFGLATAFFLTGAAGPSQSVMSLQQLPFIALYVGWFVPAWWGRVLMALFLALLLHAIVRNPAFAVNGELGIASAAHAIAIMVFCYVVAVVLWHRAERRMATDSMTGALNRRGFLAQLERDLARAERFTQPLTLVVIDFDGFKALNDTLGHAAGDDALISTVREWRGQIRARDTIGRTGGDEFAISFQRTARQRARAVIERLQRGSSHAWSWGIAQAKPGDTCETLFMRADRELYRNKREQSAS